MTYDATYQVEPIGKGRPRVTVRNGRAFAYTPKRTAAAEELIRAHVCQSKTFYEAGVPLKLRAEFVFARPKSTKRPYPTTRPDIDNCYKTLTDALNGFLFADDSQVVEAVMLKSYGLTPCIRLHIEEVSCVK